MFVIDIEPDYVWEGAINVMLRDAQYKAPTGSQGDSPLGCSLPRVRQGAGSEM